MQSTFAIGLTLVAILSLGTITADSAPTAASKESTMVRELKELLHTRTQLAVIQLRLANEIQERLSHLHPKAKRCAFGIPGAMDNCDLPDSDMQNIWDAGAGRKRDLLQGAHSDSISNQQQQQHSKHPKSKRCSFGIPGAMDNCDLPDSDIQGIWDAGAGRRSVFGIAGGSDNMDGQGAMDARNQYDIYNDMNNPGKRGTLLGLAGGSDNFDGQGALDARDQYELFNSGRTPGKRSPERRR